MNEEMLLWMNRMYPNGFFCADLTTMSLADAPVEALVILDTPLLFRLHASQLQDFVGSFIEHGASPGKSCHIPGHNISATLGNLVLRARALGLTDLFLVITE